MASCRARLAAGDSPLSGVICTLQDYLLVAANRLTAIARYARTLRICSCEAQKVRSIIITMRARTALAAAAFAAAVDALSSSSPTRWRPYLEPGAAPLKDSQCVVRFVNVPASALDASARPSADCFEIWRRGGDVVIVTGKTFSLLNVAVSAGIGFPRGKLKAPYHQDTMSDCCLVELEDPQWLDPAHPRFEWMTEQGGRRGFRPVRACDTRVELPPGCDEMVLDFTIQAGVLDEGFVDPAKRFEGDWEADFVGGSGAGRQYQKLRPLGAAGRMPEPAGESAFDTTGGAAPWDVIQ
mmetsp:Transcript_2681/g.8217  ORF Transcript_2681/g.8217 Transcript_2681/m.8217 type:complete len:296 (-) Transcript_2681:16-903(-)